MENTMQIVPTVEVIDPKTRSRNWCFTINNYTSHDVEYLLTITCPHLIFQSEVGESGTPHLQGLVGYKDTRKFGCVQNLIPRAHITRCRRFAAAVEYCQKRDSADDVCRYTRIKGKITINSINLADVPNSRTAIIKLKAGLEDLTDKQKIICIQKSEKWLNEQLTSNDPDDMYVDFLMSQGLKIAALAQPPKDLSVEFAETMMDSELHLSSY